VFPIPVITDAAKERGKLNSKISTIGLGSLLASFFNHFIGFSVRIVPLNFKVLLSRHGWLAWLAVAVPVLWFERIHLIYHRFGAG